MQTSLWMYEDWLKAVFVIKKKSPFPSIANHVSGKMVNSIAWLLENLYNLGGNLGLTFEFNKEKHKEYWHMLQS